MVNKMICIDKENRPTIHLQSDQFSARANFLPKLQVLLLLLLLLLLYLLSNKGKTLNSSLLFHSKPQGLEVIILPAGKVLAILFALNSSLSRSQPAANLVILFMLRYSLCERKGRSCTYLKDSLLAYSALRLSFMTCGQTIYIPVVIKHFTFDQSWGDFLSVLKCA